MTAAAEAEQALRTLSDAMDRLDAILEQETACARKGRLREALALAERKAEIAREYAAAAARLKAARAAVTGALANTVEALRGRHEKLQILLQTNMTVLATAHAVSEGIIRGVSSELSRRHTPSTYGAGGRANAPSPRASRPIALSRAI
jgi:roadblock/LC7 domain-containing protein